MPAPAEWIVPQWPVPPNVRSLFTTRQGGVSAAPFDTMNLGTHVGDDAEAVRRNRERLRAHLPAEPCWLQQVHGSRVVEATAVTSPAEADGCVARNPQRVCVVMVADCLPVLFCDRAGTVVAAAHAGWRGLRAGVLEATVSAMECDPARLLAYLGPAIGPNTFEVQADVLEAFSAKDPAAAACFQERVVPPGAPRKWLADLYGLARLRLHRLGVDAVFGGEFCTYSDPQRFFSHRRDRRTGRHAALIWLA